MLLILQDYLFRTISRATIDDYQLVILKCLAEGRLQRLSDVLYLVISKKDNKKNGHLFIL